MPSNKQILQNILAKIIKDLRVRQGKSISLISNEIGLAKSLWSDLEKGIKDPQFSTLWRMAEALDVPLSQLIKDIEIAVQDRVSFIEE